MSEQSSQKPALNGPLSGVRVLVTRPAADPDSLAEGLRQLGATVVVEPLIELISLPDPQAVREMHRRIDEFCMLAFLSRQSVKSFFEEAESEDLTGNDVIPKIAAIGEGTADVLRTMGFEIQHVPARSDSTSMAQMLIQRYRDGKFSKPILILRANRGSRVLPDALDEAQVPYQQFATYISRDVDAVRSSVLKELADGKFDWLTVTSSAIARNAARLFEKPLLRSTKIASISPTTSKAAVEAGLVVTTGASEYNIAGLIDAIMRHEKDH